MKRADKRLSLKLLYVHNDSLVQNVVSPAVNAMDDLSVGVEIDRAAENAMERLKVGKFSLLFTDIDVARDAEGDGLSLVREVRGESGLFHLPVSIISASGLEADVDAALALDIDDYVKLPASMRRVQNTVRRWALAFEGQNIDWSALSPHQAKLLRKSLSTCVRIFSKAQSIRHPGGTVEVGSLDFAMVKSNWHALLQAHNDERVSHVVADLQGKDLHRYRISLKVAVYLTDFFVRVTDTGAYEQAALINLLGDVFTGGLLSCAGFSNLSGPLLEKPKPLNEEERYNIEETNVAEIRKVLEKQPEDYPEVVKQICLYQAEKCDGSGPMQLRREEIPQLALMTSIVRAYLDLVHGVRSHDTKLSKKQAIVYLKERSHKFDRELLEIFIHQVLPSSGGQ